MVIYTADILHERNIKGQTFYKPYGPLCTDHNSAHAGSHMNTRDPVEPMFSQIQSVITCQLGGTCCSSNNTHILSMTCQSTTLPLSIHPCGWTSQNWNCHSIYFHLSLLLSILGILTFSTFYFQLCLNAKCLWSRSFFIYFFFYLDFLMNLCSKLSTKVYSKICKCAKYKINACGL